MRTIPIWECLSLYFASMSAPLSPDLLARVSRRGGVWLAIGAVHVALIYVLTSWAPVRIALARPPESRRYQSSKSRDSNSCQDLPESDPYPQ